PVGGGVTLSCSVDDSDGWKYDWFRRTSNSNEAQVVGEENRDIRVSQGGIYRCRGRRGKPVYYTVYSDEVTLIELIQYFYLCLSIFRGEKITVRCEIQGGGDTEWDYEWKTPQSTSHQTHVNYWTLSVSESSSGNYMCRGRNRRDSYSSTQWSKTITLTVSEKPKPQLSADYRVIPVGGSVTLSCSVNPSSGWKYYWYRGDQSSELLIRHDDVFKSNGQISVSQEGQYWCRGGRGEPVYYSQYITVSNRVVVTLNPNWSEIYHGEMITVRCEIQGGDTEWEYEWETTSSIKPSNQNEFRISSASSSHSGNYRCKGRKKNAQHETTGLSDAVTLRVSDTNPDRVQHFTSDSVSLSCEGNSTEWRVRRFPEDSYLSLCSDWGTMTGSTCNISGLNSSAVYWCESGSGQFTNSVNITGHNDDIILVSPVLPVTEGTSVTLGCKLRRENVVSNVFFYQNDKLIQNDTRVELIISAVLKSDQGFYRCEVQTDSLIRTLTSPQSWMAVKCEYD
uniref:Ig-like domain-containing protein n=1 Tax=Anabas testudineus TaxID=64144 RepID=A0A3Q1HE44_ANATE